VRKDAHVLAAVYGEQFRSRHSGGARLPILSEWHNTIGSTMHNEDGNVNLLQWE